MPEGIPVDFASPSNFSAGDSVSGAGGERLDDFLSGPQGLRVDERVAVVSPTRSSDSILGGGSAKQEGAAFFLHWPVKGKLTSAFGWREDGFHHGIDLAGNMGEPIRAAAAGRVLFAGWRPIYGKTVIIDHGNAFLTLYAHARSLMVQQGERVARGEIIAWMGNSGRSTGPHLHFEVYWRGKAVDPWAYLLPSAPYTAGNGSLGGD